MNKYFSLGNRFWNINIVFVTLSNLKERTWFVKKMLFYLFKASFKLLCSDIHVKSFRVHLEKYMLTYNCKPAKLNL